MPQIITFTDTRIESLMYGVTYDPWKDEGKILTNLSVVHKEDVDRVLNIYEQVALAGLMVSPYILLVEEGESFDDYVVPEGMMGIATTCSITIDGVILKEGIPVKPRFGGIMQVEEGEPTRFTDLLMYESTTIDPLEVMMSQDLTSVWEMMRTGNGKVLANLRLAPMSARDEIEHILEDLMNADFRGIVEVGEPNRDVLGVSIDRDHIGIVILGGTNSMAAVQEQGIPIQTKAMSSLLDIKRMDRIV